MVALTSWPNWTVLCEASGEAGMGWAAGSRVVCVVVLVVVVLALYNAVKKVEGNE